MSGGGGYSSSSGTTVCVFSHLVGLLVPSHHAHCLDEGVTWVVHACLDGLIQRVAIGRGPVAQLGVDGRRQVTCHAVVVFAQVWVLGAVQIYKNNRGAKSKNSKLAAVGPRRHRCLWMFMSSTSWMLFQVFCAFRVSRGSQRAESRNAFCSSNESVRFDRGSQSNI